jgi:hypothetical protein
LGYIFQQLKNIEAFLNISESVDRFCWTCLRRTPFRIYEHQFEKFRQSLYEARWREVMLFLKKFTALMKTLILTWCPTKYSSGIDVDGEHQAKQAKKENKMARGASFSFRHKL